MLTEKHLTPKRCVFHHKQVHTNMLTPNPPPSSEFIAICRDGLLQVGFVRFFHSASPGRPGHNKGPPNFIVNLVWVNTNCISNKQTYYFTVWVAKWVISCYNIVDMDRAIGSNCLMQGEMCFCCFSLALISMPCIAMCYSTTVHIVDILLLNKSLFDCPFMMNLTCKLRDSAQFPTSQEQILVKFFSTQKRVNRDKIDFAAIQRKWQISQQNSMNSDKKDLSPHLS